VVAHGRGGVAMTRRVLVLGGGPDAEREISLASAGGVAGALGGVTDLEVVELTVDRPSVDEIASWPDGVVFPVLHGRFGEGGPMQDRLEAAGRAYVGSGPGAARAAMDKMASKLEAARIGVPTAPAAIIDPADDRPPLPLPLVVKPVREGSSVGLHICEDEAGWARALAAIRADGSGDRSLTVAARQRQGPLPHGRGSSLPDCRVYMAERLVRGRELTVGLVAGRDGSLSALPLVEIAPASGVYDYEAKYGRTDTVYRVDPDLPADVARSMTDGALRLAARLGVRDIARVDYLLGEDGSGAVAQFLEVNTMPGFTGSSLVPKASASVGLDMAALCLRLAGVAARRGGLSGWAVPARGGGLPWADGGANTHA